MRPLSRREALGGLAAFGAGCAGTRLDSGDSTPQGCALPSTGDAALYCLVERLVVRVGGASGMLAGETMLGVVDANTAVLVGRDEGGFFARSAVCTHACCVVNLCESDACDALSHTPTDCGTVGPFPGDRALCACHGSEFRVSDGVPLTGPATTPLPAYALTLEGEDLLVDTGLEIDPTTRTPA